MILQFGFMVILLVKNLIQETLMLCFFWIIAHVNKKSVLDNQYFIKEFNYFKGLVT
jgi:hypothetical protein